MATDTLTRDHILDVAERLFMDHGYAAVTLGDVADALGIETASLYYHVPDGKEALFVEVVERAMHRHRKGLRQALDEAENTPEAQLQAAARWVLSQPPMNLIGMMKTDIPNLDDEERAEEIRKLTYDALQRPLCDLFREAQEEGHIRTFDPNLLAGSFVSILSSIQYAADLEGNPVPPEAMADQMIDVLLNGLRPRHDEASTDGNEVK